MLRRVTVRNFKRFEEQSFDLSDAVVLAGPNNSGKSTLLQAIATWRYALDRWSVQRRGSRAVRRSGVALPRTEFTAVPLREMNLLWQDRRVTGPQGMAGKRRLLEIEVEGETDREQWSCGLEFQYANPDLVYARPKNAQGLSVDGIRDFPPSAAAELSVVHVPPLSGIERDEPRRDRGLQDLVIGQGRPGEVLRNLLLEVSEHEDERPWQSLQQHVYDLFEVELKRPRYAPAQPYIVCEYREGDSRPLDLANAGSGMLQVLLLLAFLYARPSSVIMLDEPDAHQHVILQAQVDRLIRRVAREQGGQIIVATHSETILNASEPSSVIAFGGDRPRSLASGSQRDALREALKRITTTELLLGREVGRVLYTEGQSDEKILSEWARILNHPVRNFLARPFVHWLGGRSVRGANEHWFALKSAYPDIRAVCLLDGDNRDEPQDEESRSGMLVLRWRRYEIENYLLHPEAIKRFVDFALLGPQVDAGFARIVPAGTAPFDDHPALTRVKGSDEFLLPLLREIGRPTPKRDLFQVASKMTNEEINPEVRLKLDRIADGLGLNP